MPPYVGSEVPTPGLARWPAAVRAQIRDGVVDVDAAAHCGGIGKHISGVAQQDLFAQLRRYFVAVEGDVSGGKVDHRFQADRAAVPEQGVELTQHDGADVFDSGDTGARCERFGGEMYIDHGAGTRPRRVERRWGDVQRVAVVGKLCDVTGRLINSEVVF